MSSSHSVHAADLAAKTPLKKQTPQIRTQNRTPMSQIHPPAANSPTTKPRRTTHLPHRRQNPPQPRTTPLQHTVTYQAFCDITKFIRDNGDDWDEFCTNTARVARKKMWRWIASFGKSYSSDVLQYAKQLPKSLIRMPFTCAFIVTQKIFTAYSNVYGKSKSWIRTYDC